MHLKDRLLAFLPFFFFFFNNQVSNFVVLILGADDIFHDLSVHNIEREAIEPKTQSDWKMNQISSHYLILKNNLCRGL